MSETFIESASDKPDVTRLRRFALSVGLLLFFYSIAGVKLKTPADIHPLGIPFEVLRPNLLPFALILASAYAAARYWYYGIVVSASPHKTRKKLSAGEIPTKTRLELGVDPQIRHGQVMALLSRYFPKMNCKVTIVGNDIRLEIPLKTKFRARLLIWLENLDYSAPIWINILAIATYFLHS